MVKVLISFLLFAGLCGSLTAQVKLKPAADGYIYLGGAKMDANFGGSDTLVTRYARRAESTAQTFILFDLAGQASHFGKVTFNIYGKGATLVDVFSAFGA